MSVIWPIPRVSIFPLPKQVTYSVIFGLYAAAQSWVGKIHDDSHTCVFPFFFPNCEHRHSRHSHETHPILAPPTPPSFGMDFQQLLQATTAPRAKNMFNQKNRTDTSSRTHKSKSSTSRAIETIVEDDGWDLVDDATDAFE
jgi:hypothetical protein